MAKSKYQWVQPPPKRNMVKALKQGTPERLYDWLLDHGYIEEAAGSIRGSRGGKSARKAKRVLTVRRKSSKRRK